MNIIKRVWNAIFDKHYHTPEKVAERQLKQARMGLYAAEQEVQNAIAQADYYRKRLIYLEAVSNQGGIENWSDRRSLKNALGRHPDLARGAEQKIEVVDLPYDARPIDDSWMSAPVRNVADTAVNAMMNDVIEGTYGLHGHTLHRSA